MALAYLQLFADAEEYLQILDDAQRGRMVSAMMAYAFRGDEPSLESSVEKMAWIAMRRMIDQSKTALDAKRAGGKSRQQAAADSQQDAADAQQTSADSQQTPADAQQAAADIQHAAADGQQNPAIIKNQESRIKKQEYNGGDIRARERFKPPSVEDVQAFCTAQGIKLDPERFVAYYESNGWMVGKNRMKDWHAAVRSWTLRDGGTASAQKPCKTVREQQYTQREYTHNEDAVNQLMRGV